ncbi:hypothetical protein HDK77DRAFT_433112 [Phyllosticta capitalensis]
MLWFGLGGLFYVAILLTNAIAVLSEDRFLARSKAPRPCLAQRACPVPDHRPPRSRPRHQSTPAQELAFSFTEEYADKNPRSRLGSPGRAGLWRCPGHNERQGQGHSSHRLGAHINEG